MDGEKKGACGRVLKQRTSRAAEQCLSSLRRTGSQLKQNEAALSIKCKICLQPFICTSAEVKLREHRCAPWCQLVAKTSV